MAPAAALGPYDSSEAVGRLLLRELEGLGLYHGERFLGCMPLAAPDTFLLLTHRRAALHCASLGRQGSGPAETQRQGF